MTTGWLLAWTNSGNDEVCWKITNTYANTHTFLSRHPTLPAVHTRAPKACTYKSHIFTCMPMSSPYRCTRAHVIHLYAYMPHTEAHTHTNKYHTNISRNMHGHGHIHIPRHLYLCRHTYILIYMHTITSTHMQYT